MPMFGIPLFWVNSCVVAVTQPVSRSRFFTATFAETSRVNGTPERAFSKMDVAFLAWMPLSLVRISGASVKKASRRTCARACASFG